MSIPPAQAATADLLRRLAGCAPAETHISAVYVGENTVWKLKKAVRLSFLDFSDLAARQLFAHRELELNRDAAPGLYRDVVAVVRRPDGTLALGEPGEIVDWVLRMARVPVADFFDRIAAEGRLTTALLDALADTVADFHGKLLPAPGADAVAGLRRTIEGNAGAALAGGLDTTAIEEWREGMLAGVLRLAPRLSARKNMVRRAHGDLHLGNLCLWQGRPVPFDALEFDEDLATIDLGYDLAFLLMDLERRADRPAANRVLNRYLDRTGDVGLVALLPLFLSLRAMVRAHVEAASGRHAESDAYLANAQSYLTPAPAVAIAIGGLPGTGKSTLARAIAPYISAAPGAVVLRSDTIRKRRHQVAPEARLAPDTYTPGSSAAVMAELVASSRDLLAGGHGVIADATFLHPADRQAIAALGGRFLGVWLSAPRALLEGRIAARRGDASDATPELLGRLVDPGPGDWLPVDATDAAAAARQVQEHLARIPCNRGPDRGVLRNI